MEPTPADRPTAILIDDFAPGRRTVSKFLENHGWRVIGAEDAIGAYQYLHSGAREVADVYLIDLLLPGEPGVAIIETLRTTAKRSPRTGLPVRIIAFTALDDDSPQVLEAIKAGADAVVLKPPDLSRLLLVMIGEDTGDALDLARPPSPPIPEHPG